MVFNKKARISILSSKVPVDKDKIIQFSEQNAHKQILSNSMLFDKLKSNYKTRSEDEFWVDYCTILQKIFKFDKSPENKLIADEYLKAFYQNNLFGIDRDTLMSHLRMVVFPQLKDKAA